VYSTHLFERDSITFHRKVNDFEYEFTVFIILIIDSE